MNISQLLENTLLSRPLGRLYNILHDLVISRETLGLLEYRFLAEPVGVLFFFSDEFHRFQEENKKIGALGVFSRLEQLNTCSMD